ncbi:uncharacterized protein LOC113340852 [Papaver somniferum]|uniref:uncharacterized protein LOC113340852 n=1 Tax=Papaver somniferum TaxID=3469 RepID=UPI000E6F704D|nr:uncharacterized protein LOC113340852 [Papaver somniferum]
MWGSNGCEHVYLPLEGRSGGVLLMWNSSVVVMEESLLGEFLVTLIFRNTSDGFTWIFTSVYGATDPADYEQFWQEIQDVRLLMSGPWMLGGDWNAPLFASERSSIGGCNRNRRNFRKFVNKNSLVDIPMSGGSFTWTNSQNPPILLRLDRFIFTTDWEEKCIGVVQFRCRRPISDHAPVLLNCNENLTFSSRPSYIFAKKLQGLKFFIKKWGRETYGSLQAEVDKLEMLIDVYDSLEEIGGSLNEGDYAARESTKIKHNQASLNLTKKWFSRSKGLWLADGETNSRFFHKNSYYNHKINSINSLIVDGVMSHDKDIINEEAKRFYEEGFTEKVYGRPTFEGMELPKISVEQSIGMEKPIEEDEVKKVIWGFGRNKSPGPDGYKMEFFKDVWDIIKPELMAVMKEFQQTGYIDWRLNYTNIILIPKCEGASSMEFQGAFEDGRKITDGILIASELIDSREREGKPGLI